MNHPLDDSFIKSVVDTTSAPLTISDYRSADMPIIYANQAFYDLTGYTPSEVIGKNCRFLQTDDTSSQALDSIRTALKEKTQCSVELLNERKDGTLFWNNLLLSPIKTADGEVTHYAGMQVDASDQINARDEAIHATRKYEKLLSSIDEGYCVVELLYNDEGLAHDFVYKEANQAFTDQSGLSNVVGKNVKSFVPNLEQSWFDKYAEVARTGKSIRFVDKSRAMGIVFNVFASKVDTNDADSHTVALIFTDITRQVEAENRLKRQLEFTSMITDNSNSCLYIIDNNGLVTYSNPTATKVTGYAPKDIIGQSLHDLTHHTKDDGSDYPAEECDLYAAYTNGKKFKTQEQTFFKKDGSTFTGLISSNSIIDSNDQKISVVEIRDITDLKKVQLELKESENAKIELEQKNIYLEKKTQLLKQIDRTRDEFISLASHQLRTPATGVRQYIGLLLEGYAGDITEIQKNYLLKADESNVRQLRIIDDMLRVATLDGNNLKLKKQQFNVSELLKDIIDGMDSEIKARDQCVVLDPRTNVTLNGDEKYLRMVFENIISNALKYSAPNTVISISVEQHGESVQIDIHDQGVGIRKAQQKHLFKKFSRIHNEYSVSSGGSGLGLYISKKIIDLHGGFITVTSSRNSKGTTFTVTLPLI